MSFRIATIKRIIDKISLHVTVKVRYVTRKTRYHISSAHGSRRSSRVEYLIRKCIPADYKPKVFLQMDLETIDEIIKEDIALQTFIMAEGERSYQNEWIVLNSRRKDMYDAECGHYRWTEDIFTDFHYKKCFYMDARTQSATVKGTDIKVPWEIARMQSLFSLALAYRASADEKYAGKIIDIIKDFSVCCPVGEGVNWNVSMEVGIRISNILLACELIKDSCQFNYEFTVLLATLVYQHMIHIRQNIENEKDGGNHLLADILGLASTSAAMPFLPGASACAAYTQKIIQKELMRQVLQDGGHFEGSVSYHRLVGEILCFSVLAQKNLGFSLSAEENDRLFMMGQFTHGLRMRNGLIPQFGDNDSGRVFQLAVENTRDHDSFINLVTAVTKGCIIYPQKKDGFFVFAPKNITFGGNVFPSSRICEYPYFKCIRVQNDKVYVALSGMTPELVNKVGHSHNDILSFCLTVGDEEFIVDPGSGEYTGDISVRHTLRSVHSHSTVSVDENEQRHLPDDLSQTFKWSSSAQSAIWVEQREDGISMYGKCSYLLSETSVSHERTIDIRENQIYIHDIVSGIKDVCSISLPILPSNKIEIENNMVSILGGNYKIIISGSWEFTMRDSFYAIQYKTVVQNKIVRGNSHLKENWMRIDIVEIPNQHSAF